VHRVKVALRHENTRQWHEVEQDFISAEYRSVRDRQLRELEDEDDLLSKVPVRTLRAKLYSESSEFVRQQRLHCLLAGAWFAHAVPGPQSALGGGQGQSAALAAARARPWRFMRLDAGMRFLHYVDAERKFPVRPGMEDLPERIDVALIHEVSTGTGRAPANLLPGYAAAAAAAMSSSSVSFSMGSPMSGASTMKSLGGFSSGGSGTRSSSGGPAAGVGSTSSGGAGGADAASPLSFALLNTEHGALAELVAPDAARWADWTDGLNMLRREGGHGSSEETAAFVSALTEIGLKIRLLGECSAFLERCLLSMGTVC
jgi:engulfment/cell motility protein 1